MCYDKISVNVSEILIRGYVSVKFILKLLRTTHSHNHELQFQPHLPRFYHNNTLLYRIL
jgi:hypothetical protein